MYQGEVHIGQEQLKEFLKAAQLLQVRGLTDVPAPGPLATIDQKASPVSYELLCRKTLLVLTKIILALNMRSDIHILVMFMRNWFYSLYLLYRNCNYLG